MKILNNVSHNMYENTREVASLPKQNFHNMIKPVLCIRIRIRIRIRIVPGSRRAKMTHKNRKSYEISSSDVLDVLFRALTASHVARTAFIRRLRDN
jgi:hypothetical protein